MPSGAKRRKAAKKKKEQEQQQTNNNSSSSSINNRNDDPKSQDERDSDGGEVGSPASQDHHNQFNEENEKESEKKGVATDDAHGGQNVEIVWEMKSEQDGESKDVSVEHVESAKESHGGDDKSSSSSSSSSSDDESHSFDKKWKEEEAHNSALDAASLKNVGKVFPEEVTRDSGINKPIGEANGTSVVETERTDDLAEPEVPMSEVAKHVIEGAAVESPEILDVVEPGLQDNVDKLLPKPNYVIAGLVPEKNVGKASLTSEENAGVSRTVATAVVNGNESKKADAHSTETTICAEVDKVSETLGGTVTENEGKVSAPSGAHISEASEDPVKVRDYVTSEYTETQPLVPPAPRVTQRTSWMNCCGLFDLFTGFNR